MQYCIFVGDWASAKAQFDNIFRSLFHIKPFWPPGLDLASRLICRSVGFFKVCAHVHGGPSGGYSMC